LIESPVAAEELEAAKRAIIGTYELRHQTNAAQAESLALMELYGLGYQAVRHYPEKIQSVTSKDLQRVARRYLTLDRYVLAVVGPSAHLDVQGHADRTQKPREKDPVPKGARKARNPEGSSQLKADP
jgi:predicted Zn-dependent peptidase